MVPVSQSWTAGMKPGATLAPQQTALTFASVGVPGTAQSIGSEASLGKTASFAPMGPLDVTTIAGATAVPAVAGSVSSLPGVVDASQSLKRPTTGSWPSWPGASVASVPPKPVATMPARPQGSFLQAAVRPQTPPATSGSLVTRDPEPAAQPSTGTLTFGSGTALGTGAALGTSSVLGGSSRSLSTSKQLPATSGSLPDSVFVTARFEGPGFTQPLDAHRISLQTADPSKAVNVEEVMEELDKDHDGKISRKEFEDAVAAGLIEDQDFDELDKNHDGEIDLSELEEDIAEGIAEEELEEHPEWLTSHAIHGPPHGYGMDYVHQEEPVMYYRSHHHGHHQPGAGTGHGVLEPDFWVRVNGKRLEPTWQDSAWYMVAPVDFKGLASMPGGGKAKYLDPVDVGVHHADLEGHLPPLPPPRHWKEHKSCPIA